MPQQSYYEKLKDPRWQKKRLEKMDQHGFACEACYNEELTLHVHHKVYFKGRDPWEYELDQLAVLCEDCHQREHEDDYLSEAISRLPYDGPENRHQLAFLVMGMLGLKLRPITHTAEAVSYLMGQDYANTFPALASKAYNHPDSDFGKMAAALIGE